jgi:hypothetical protein
VGVQRLSYSDLSFEAWEANTEVDQAYYMPADFVDNVQSKVIASLQQAHLAHKENDEESFLQASKKLFELWEMWMNAMKQSFQKDAAC